jgi:hypothetical protein
LVRPAKPQHGCHSKIYFAFYQLAPKQIVEVVGYGVGVIVDITRPADEEAAIVCITFNRCGLSKEYQTYRASWSDIKQKRIRYSGETLVDK